MHKLNKIKIGKLIFCFLIFLFILYVLFHSRTYEVNYTLEDVSVTEKYDKKEQVYRFSLKRNDQEFFTLFEHKYFHSKKLIQDIEVKEKEDTLCLIPKSKKLSFVPLCQKNGEWISYTLVKDTDLIPEEYQKTLENEEKSYNALTLYHLDDKKYYIWNYTGFYVITKDTQKEMKLFNTDVYNIPITTKTKDYLVMANYDEKYAFTKFYVIDTKKDKIRELNLKEEIPYDAYFLGSTNKKTYLVDKKNKKEFEIYPKRLLIENIAHNNQGTILKEDKWEPIGIQSLVSNENAFTRKEYTSYIIENNTLYKVQDTYKTKVTEKEVKEIVTYDKENVYYLVDDKLYTYNDTFGEVLIMSHFEWNFNYKNMIYIF